MPGFGILANWEYDIVHVYPLIDFYQKEKMRSQHQQSGRRLFWAYLRVYREYQAWKKYIQISINLEDSNEEVEEIYRSRGDADWHRSLADIRNDCNALKDIFIVVDNPYKVEFDQ
jgi:hypothetical protein